MIYYLKSLFIEPKKNTLEFTSEEAVYLRNVLFLEHERVFGKDCKKQDKDVLHSLLRKTDTSFFNGD